VIALPIFVWWLASTVLGLLALPVAWRVFTRLPDRGLGLARPLGILMSGFALWLGGSIGLWPNGLAGSLAGVAVLAAASVWAWRGGASELRIWLRENLRAIAVTEALFLAGFVVWALVRAFNPDIVATEKPMELAFLNSVLRSPSLPPADPWLSGYAISYYYFGYILLGHLATLTATPGSMAFNLGVALWFGLAVTATYSLLVNLLSARDGKLRLAGGLLGPLFVVITGNLAGFLEVLHSLRLGWRRLADGTLTARFWPWLDILDLSDPPGGAIGFLPTRYLWWWRASRVVHDASLTGDKIEVIDEFPFFSFLLADNHPHLLALPFVLLAVGFALQVYLMGRRSPQRLVGPRSGVPAFRGAAWMAAVIALGGAAAGAGAQLAAQAPAAEVILGALRAALLLGAGSLLLIVFAYVALGRLHVLLSLSEFGFAAIAFGALAFLNTWDLPIYLLLLLIVLAWQARSESGGQTLRALVATAVALGVAALLLYLPWFLSFRSQLGGILPNLAYPTRLSQFSVMFATSLVPLAVWLLGCVRPAWRREDTRTLLLLGLGLPLSLLAASWILAGLLGATDPTLIDLFLTKIGAASWREALAGIVARRLTRSWTALFLGAVIALAFILLRQFGRSPRRDESNAADLRPFIAILVGIAGLLALAPEFVYLRDGFGDRMNTIFKFYFAGWILWGLAAAYAVTELWPRRSSLAGALRTLALLPVLFGLAYPILATWTITRGFTAEYGPTLDGAAHLARSAADDYAAIQWINAGLPRGVIAEAARSGSSYSGYGRIATHTGLPAVLGWDFHEWQWRGSWAEQGTRLQDLATLYSTRDWNEARAIMDRYAIVYVYVGPLEASTYQPIAVTKFGLFLKKIYDNGAVVIFARPEAPVP
jgi:uncharacterized membrane protein